MNFLRNPFSIKKVLNTIGLLSQYEPTDPDLLAQFKKVMAGSKPQETYLCSELGITPNEYRSWLAVLFLMLTRPIPDQPNFMEQTVKSLYEMPSGFPTVHVHRYTSDDPDKVCLLPDRGFASPLPEPFTAFNFNLSSRAFVTYIFVPIEGVKPPPSVPAPIFEKIIESYRSSRKTVSVVPFLNNFDALARYNENAVAWCYRSVYSSSRTAYGVNTNTT
jgi:hypothetical protein